MRDAHLSVFRGARRFHTGDIAGDEVPIIAKKGGASSRLARWLLSAAAAA
jgi:hypothetical protein